MTDASDWTGSVGGVWASEWQGTDRSFGDLARRLDAVILAAAPDTGRVLDIGCGAGTTSLALAVTRPHLAVVGADLSADQIAVARERVGGLANLRFVEGDVLRVAAANGPFDLMVSRHGVMFFADPVAAFAALHAAASPGAALVFSCFREPAANAWATEIAAAVTGAVPAPRSDTPGPFAFAEAARIHQVLSDAGWSIIDLTPVDYASLIGAGDDPVSDAVRFFSRIGPAAPLLRALPPGPREAALERVAKVCAARRAGNTIAFPAAAWLCSAQA